VTHLPCHGRFQLEVSATTQWGEIFQILLLQIGCGVEFFSAPDSSPPLEVDALSAISSHYNEAVLYYQRVTTCTDTSTETSQRKKKKRKWECVQNFPPSGVSRFKYLLARTATT
jgi:hypothetical protein